MKQFILIAALLALPMAQAADMSKCVLHVNRTACPGKDAESFKKCDGKKECDEDGKADSEAKCKISAMKACDNARTDITQSKTVTAKFDGKDINGGKDFCGDKRSDFNKCK